jgi:hypothetical protein
MNVEIGTEAAQFPEKEYVHKWDFRYIDHCSTMSNDTGNEIA